MATDFAIQKKNCRLFTFIFHTWKKCISSRKRKIWLDMPSYWLGNVTLESVHIISKTKYIYQAWNCIANSLSSLNLASPLIGQPTKNYIEVSCYIYKVPLKTRPFFGKLYTPVFINFLETFIAAPVKDVLKLFSFICHLPGRCFVRLTRSACMETKFSG